MDLGNLTIHHHDDASTVLASLTIPPITIPLTSQPPSDSSWLTNLSTEVYVVPTQDADTITAFARDSWAVGVLSVQYYISHVIVSGGDFGESSWRKRLHIERTDLKRYFKMQSQCTEELRRAYH